MTLLKSNEKINKMIKILIVADLLFWGGWSFLGPIFAVFVLQKIAGANVFVVGLLAGVYFIVKAIFEVPISFYLDRHAGEKDDFLALILGLFLAGTTAFLFLLARDVIFLLLTMFIQGISFALYSTAWPTIFSRHLDKDFASLEWALDHMGIDLVSAIAAFLGGSLAYFMGFEVIFLLSTLLAYLSALTLLLVFPLVLPKDREEVFFIKHHERR